MKTLFAMLAFVGFMGIAHAEDVDVQKLVADTQIVRHSGQSMDLVWWIPTEYWSISFRKSGSLTPQQIDDLLKAIDDYTVVAVMEGTIGTLGVLAGTPQADLEKKTTLLLGAQTLKPIGEDDLTPAARNFFKLMRPMMASMLGQMGSGMHMLAFKGHDEKGKRIVDPLTNGKLTVQVGDKEFSYRLPVAALLPQKIDPKSGEKFPGNYEFNPYTGAKLSATK